MTEELSKIKVCWLDDQKKVFDTTIGSLQNEFKDNYDLELEFDPYLDATQFEKEVTKDADRADIIFLDIDLQSDKNGIDVYKNIRKRNKEIAAVFVSGHLNDPKYEEAIDQLRGEDPRLFTIRLGFPTRRDPEYYKLVAIPIINSINSVKKIYKAPYESFLMADANGRLIMQESANRFDRPFVEKYFAKKPDIQWVVMGSDPGIVLKEGRGDSVLTSDELFRISEEKGIMVTGYQRDKNGPVKVIDNPSTREYVQQRIPKAIEIVYGKIVSEEEGSFLVKCKSMQDPDDVQLRRFESELFSHIHQVGVNSFVEIRIITYPGERKFLFNAATRVNKMLFEKRKYFENKNYDTFFNLDKPGYEDSI